MSEPKHEYPSQYGPEHGGDLAIAWEILDSVEPGIISLTVRSFLAGQIVGTIMKIREEERAKKHDPR